MRIVMLVNLVSSLPDLSSQVGKGMLCFARCLLLNCPF